MKTSREMSGAGFGLLSWLFPIAISLTVTPQIVRGLGTDGYGLYSLVLGFIGYSFNLNVSRAVTKYTSEYVGTGDHAKIASVVTTGILLSCILGAIAFTTISLGANWYVSSVLALEAFRAESVLGLVIGGSIIAVLLINQVFLAVIQGYQAYRQYSWLSVFTAGVTALANLVMVRLGRGFVAVLCATLAASLVGATVAAIYARRIVGGKLISRPQPGSIRLMLAYSKYVIGYQVAGNIVLLFERTWISRTLGPEGLTFYVLPMMVCLQFNGLVNGLSMFLFPFVAGQRAEGMRSDNVYFMARKLVIAMAVLALAGVALFGREFLTFWIGGELAENSYRIFVIMMVGFSALAVSVIPFHTAEGFGHPSLNFIFTVMVSVVTVGVMCSPVLPLSLDRFAVARAVGFSLWLPAMFVIERLTVGTSRLRDLAASIPPLLLSVAVLAVVGILVRTLIPERWYGFLLSVILAGLGAVATLWLTKYFDEVRDYFRKAE